MKQLTIVIPKGKSNLSSISGAYMIFRRANELWQRAGHRGGFEVQVAGQSREIRLNDGLFAIRPDVALREVRKTDLVIIPALFRPYAQAIAKNGELIRWLHGQYTGGAALASICTGAFLLASTGLLHGRRCSTHWAAEAEFARMFPDVQLAKGEVITDEDGIYTNGGAFSFLNLILYLVEKYYDRQTAIHCAKIFQIDIERNSQSPYTIFSGQKHHDDPLVLEAQAFLENHFDEKVSMEKVAQRFAAGRRNFDRRFIRATGDTPAVYLQRIRVEAAKRSFEQSRKTVNEVMYEVGYSDAKAFRETFKRTTGLSPLEYRNKYHKAVSIQGGQGMLEAG